jgi:WD40 repeat protein
VLVSPGSVESTDARTFRRRALRPLRQSIHAFAAFTPDGRSLIVTSYAGWVQLWSAKTLRPQTRRFGGQMAPVLWAAVSPDGRTLAAGGLDGTVRLFDVPSQQPVGAPLLTLPNRAAAPLFSADGAHLFALTDAGVGYRWDVRPASWEARACAVAGRPLTRAEWSAALPHRPYAPACAG